MKIIEVIIAVLLIWYIYRKHFSDPQAHWVWKVVLVVLILAFLLIAPLPFQLKLLSL